MARYNSLGTQDVTGYSFNGILLIKRVSIGSEARGLSMADQGYGVVTCSSRMQSFRFSNISWSSSSIVKVVPGIWALVDFTENLSIRQI